MDSWIIHLSARWYLELHHATVQVLQLQVAHRRVDEPLGVQLDQLDHHQPINPDLALAGGEAVAVALAGKAWYLFIQDRHDFRDIGLHIHFHPLLQ